MFDKPNKNCETKLSSKKGQTCDLNMLKLFKTVEVPSKRLLFGADLWDRGPISTYRFENALDESITVNDEAYR